MQPQLQKPYPSVQNTHPQSQNQTPEAEGIEMHEHIQSKYSYLKDLERQFLLSRSPVFFPKQMLAGIACCRTCHLFVVDAVGVFASLADHCTHSTYSHTTVSLKTCCVYTTVQWEGGLAHVPHSLVLAL